MKLTILSLLASLSLVVRGQSTLTVTNLNDSGPGSLRQLVFNSNSGDFIRFDNSLIASGSDTIFLNFPIIVDNGVHISGLISGADTLYISGHDSTQIFFMDFTNAPGHEVHLDSLVIIDAKKFTQDGTVPNQNGGAIYAEGLLRLSITNSVFRNCRVSGNGVGGAIYAYNTPLFIEHSQFLGNHTDTILSQGVFGGIGGAISCRLDSFICKSTRFSNNYSGDRAGALYLGASLFKIENSIFTNNQTGWVNPAWQILDGGAIYISACQQGTIKNSEFKGNLASQDGGAIAVRDFSQNGNTIHISSSLFLSNTCEGNGAALSSTYYDVNLNNNTFSSNHCLSTSSTRGGGAFYSNRGDNSLSNCTFSENLSSSLGGAILFYLGSAHIENSSFINNESSTGSNDVDFSLNQINTLTISSSIFSGDAQNSSIANHPNITSLGYNVFSDIPSFSISSDQTNIDSLTLALEPLAFNGGRTQTMLPGPMSVALNTGNPADFSDAQNGPIYGRRDAGAAERAVIIYDTTLACSPTSWWGNTYNTAGTYSDTAFNANSIDSVGVLVMYRQDTSVFDLDGTLYASEDDTNTTYQWVDCDNNWTPISGATSRNFLPPSNGNYAVILTNQNCIDTSSCFSYNRFNIYEAATDTKWITFYPNPTTDQLYIDFTTQPPTQLELLDIWGRTVLTQPLQSGVSSIQLPELSAGTYIMRWTSATGEIQVDRIVIQE